MPALEESDLVHDIVVWTIVARDINNEPVVDDGAETVGRWYWQDRSGYRSGETDLLNWDASVSVYHDLVCPIGSLMVLGTLAAYNAADLCEVVGDSKGDDLTGKFTRRLLKVRRWKGTLPGTGT